MRLAHQKRAIQRKDDRTSSSLLCFSYRRVPAEYYLKKKERKKTLTVLKEQDRPLDRRRPHCGPCILVSCRKDWRSSPKKCALNSQKLCRKLVSVGVSPNLEETVLKKLFKTSSIANEWSWLSSAQPRSWPCPVPRSQTIILQVVYLVSVHHYTFYNN